MDNIKDLCDFVDFVNNNTHKVKIIAHKYVWYNEEYCEWWKSAISNSDFIEYIGDNPYYPGYDIDYDQEFYEIIQENLCFYLRDYLIETPDKMPAVEGTLETGFGSDFELKDKMKLYSQIIQNQDDREEILVNAGVSLYVYVDEELTYEAHDEG